MVAKKRRFSISQNVPLTELKGKGYGLGSQTLVKLREIKVVDTETLKRAWDSKDGQKKIDRIISNRNNIRRILKLSYPPLLRVLYEPTFIKRKFISAITILGSLASIIALLFTENQIGLIDVDHVNPNLFEGIIATNKVDPGLHELTRKQMAIDHGQFLNRLEDFLDLSTTVSSLRLGLVQGDLVKVDSMLNQLTASVESLKYVHKVF